MRLRLKVDMLPSSIFLLFVIPFFSTVILVILPIDATFNAAARPIISFCAGQAHACAVFDSFTMKCWGYGLGIGSSRDYGYSSITLGDTIPYFNPGTSLQITKVTCLNSATCILLDNRSIKCVGSNQFGQTGNGISNNPIGSISGHVGDALPIANLGSGVNVASVVGGNAHACILSTDNKIKCFGRNDFGQLGYGDTTQRGTSASQMGNNLPYVDFGTGVEVASVHSGPSAYHSCVILSAPAIAAQRLKCWGWNSIYQLGYGNRNNRGDNSGEMGVSLALVDLGTESRVKQLALGQQHTCVILVNDALKCIGYGFFGQLGSGSSSDIISTGSLIPTVLIDSGKTVQYLVTGNVHTCISYNDMTTMKCFGGNGNGQLGQGDLIPRGQTSGSMIPSIPAIDLGTRTLQIQSIHSGESFNCIVFVDYTVKCFGNNSRGQMANGSNVNVGDGPGEMGSNLHFAEIFSPTRMPTKAPSQSPTKKPTSLPTKKPTMSPSNRPTFLPTKKPTSDPTLTPTISPTNKPSRNPTTKSPTRPPTSSPIIFCGYTNQASCDRDVYCEWISVNGISRCSIFWCEWLSYESCKKESRRCAWEESSFKCFPTI